LVNEGATNDKRGLVVGQSGVYTDVHVGWMDVKVPSGLGLVLLGMSLTIMDRHGIWILKGILVKAGRGDVLILHALKTMSIEGGYARLLKLLGLI
jgi:hypothetical protein